MADSAVLDEKRSGYAPREKIFDSITINLHTLIFRTLYTESRQRLACIIIEPR